MVNPSGRYTYSDYPISLIVTTIVVLMGMISLTGGTVGYITSVINGILEKSAQSKNKVVLKDDALDSPVLRGKWENHALDADADSIELDKEDDLVVIRFT